MFLIESSHSVLSYNEEGLILFSLKAIKIDPLVTCYKINVGFFLIQVSLKVIAVFLLYFIHENWLGGYTSINNVVTYLILVTSLLISHLRSLVHVLIF